MHEPRITSLLGLWGFLVAFGLGQSTLRQQPPFSNRVINSSTAVPSGHSQTAPNSDDRFSDGTPDCLRLDSPSDKDAFRRWFVLIAEFQALRPPNELPSEINDCAALLRYAYRNALPTHDANWFRETQMESPSALPSLEKYRYPHTPLGAARSEERRVG